MAKIKMFITKYVAAKGGEILEKIGKIEAGRFYPDGGEVWNSFTVGKEAFESREDAVADAKKRVAKKIKSHEQSIAALKALTF